MEHMYVWMLSGGVAALLLLIVLIWRLTVSARQARRDLERQQLQTRLEQVEHHVAQSLADVSEKTALRLNDLSERLDAKFQQTAQILAQNLGDVSGRIDKRLGDSIQMARHSSEQTNQRLEGASRAVGDVQARLVELSEANRRIFELGRSMKELQQILSAPKLRGVLGEILLGELLGQILPASLYELQYAFSTRETVDAVVRLQGGILPIDAKFPLENFRKLAQATDPDERGKIRRVFLRDVKKRIDEIATKYIRPDEATLELALMYIPAEGVYYESFLRPDSYGADLSDYALSRRVIPVSPNSLYAYLQIIRMAARGLQVQSHAREILDLLGSLKVEFDQAKDEAAKLGRHLGNAVNSQQALDRRLDRLGNTLKRRDDLFDLPENSPGNGEELASRDASR